jgi:hypothetical protein
MFFLLGKEHRMSPITHREAEEALCNIPLKGEVILFGCHVTRLSIRFWRIDDSEPLMLLAAIDALLRRHQPLLTEERP